MGLIAYLRDVGTCRRAKTGLVMEILEIPSQESLRPYVVGARDEIHF